MKKPREITWQELKEFVNSVPEEYMQKNIPILIEDESYARNLNESFFIQNDIYSNIEDSEDCGTLEELKNIWKDEFNESNYQLITKKGTPFLWSD